MQQERRNYNRVLLKISGEGFCKDGGFGLDIGQVRFIGDELAECLGTGKEIAVVIGGGNFIRGAIASEKSGLGRATADYMGMLATIINGMALQDTLEALGFETRLMSALTATDVAEPFIRRRCTRHLEKGRIVILVGGTGNPYFTTDTQAALRASEIKADILLKATKVDGVYSADPLKDPSAERYDTISYEEVLKQKLRIMDASAIDLCAQNSIPIMVFCMRDRGNLLRALSGEKIGTIISAQDS
jgi:uridylate kinase